MATPEVLIEKPQIENLDRDIITTYLQGLHESEKSVALYVAKNIASFDNPLADTIVAIPVAAHQESPQIYNTLKQYALQRECDDFTVVLDLNSPRVLSPEKELEVEKTKAEVERAKQMYPWLDVRQFEIRYDTPNIGRIRRDLWNGLCVAYMKFGMSDVPPICMNQDIDLVKMSDRTISNVQKRYDHMLEVGVNPHEYFGGVSMNHAPNYDFPNISSVVAWNDFLHRKMNQTFEAGLLMTLSAYAVKDGFDASAVTSEVFGTLEGGHYDIVPGAHALTSIRRYLDRMGRFGLSVWHPDSEFTADDDCRIKNQFKDISSREKRQLLGQDFEVQVGRLVTRLAQEFIGMTKVYYSLDPEMYKTVFYANDGSFPKDLFFNLLTKEAIITQRVLKKVGASKKQLQVALNMYQFDDAELPLTIRDLILLGNQGELEPYKDTVVDVGTFRRPNAPTLKIRYYNGKVYFFNNSGKKLKNNLV